MTQKKEEKEGGLVRSLFVAHIILLLHIGLLAVAGVTVVLFKGFYHYLPWIMAALGILVLFTAWFFYRRMRTSSADLHKVLSRPEFRDREVEVRLMGGMASLKMGAPNTPPDRMLTQEPETLSLSSHSDQQAALDRLYEQKLITREAYLKAGQELKQKTGG